MTLKFGALAKLGLFFPVVCFIYVSEQTLAEQLYGDKGLLTDLCSMNFDWPPSLIVLYMTSLHTARPR